jgi:hypothetical protein
MFRPRGRIPRAPGDRYALQILGRVQTPAPPGTLLHGPCVGFWRHSPPPDSVTVPAMKAAPAISNHLAFVMILISLLVPSKPRIDFNLSPASEPHIHRSVDIALLWVHRQQPRRRRTEFWNYVGAPQQARRSFTDSRFLRGPSTRI